MTKKKWVTHTSKMGVGEFINTLSKREKKKHPFSQTQIQSHQDLPNCQEESNIF